MLKSKRKVYGEVCKIIEKHCATTIQENVKNILKQMEQRNNSDEETCIDEMIDIITCSNFKDRWHGTLQSMMVLNTLHNEQWFAV